jgi:hypothetical protein
MFLFFSPHQHQMALHTTLSPRAVQKAPVITGWLDIIDGHFMGTAINTNVNYL